MGPFSAILVFSQNNISLAALVQEFSKTKDSEENTCMDMYLNKQL